MKFKRKLLIAALDAVMSGLGSDDKVAQSGCFIFINGYVYTFNDEIAISHPVEELKEFNGAVQAKQFYATLHKAGDEELEIKVSGGGAVLTGKKFKAKIKLSEEILLPIDEIQEPGEDDWHPLPPNFSEAVKFCSFTARKDTAKPILTYVDVQGSQVQSCDDHRLTRFDMTGTMAIPVLIPASAAAALEAFDPNFYGINAGWLHFSADNGAMFSCRTTSMEDYPDMSFIMDFSGEPFEFPAETKAMVEKAGIFSADSNDSGESITVSLTKSHLKIKGEGEIGWIEESSRVRYKGDDVKFLISPAFLKEIVNHTTKAEIGDGRILFKGEKFTHVVCLMKSEG